MYFINNRMGISKYIYVNFLQTCHLCCRLVTDLLRGSRQHVMDLLLRGNWCNGFGA